MRRVLWLLGGLWWITVRLYVAVFSTAERFLRWCSDHSDPTSLGRFIITVLVVCCGAAFWIPSSWANWFSYSGFFVTVAGFVYTIYQLFQSRSALEAEASGRRRQAAEHYRDYLLDTQALVMEVRAFVTARKWQVASALVNHLSRQATRIQHLRTHANNRWADAGSLMKQWSLVFQQGKNGVALPQPMEEWETLIHDFHGYLQEDVFQIPLQG